jgi:hypothetical protein
MKSKNKTKKSGLKNNLLPHDFFGHTINLNFDGNGDSHNTIIGALFSILIKVVMAVYTFYNFKKMFLFEDNNIY